MKPHESLRQLQVHPKDKREVKHTAEVVYSIPRKDCPIVYIGETESRFGVREKEHRKDGEQLEKGFAWARKKESLTMIHQSAVTDHAGSKNHMIDWDKTVLPVKEADWTKRDHGGHFHQEGWDVCHQL